MLRKHRETSVVRFCACLYDGTRRCVLIAAVVSRDVHAAEAVSNIAVNAAETYVFGVIGQSPPVFFTATVSQCVPPSSSPTMTTTARLTTAGRRAQISLDKF